MHRLKLIVTIMSSLLLICLALAIYGIKVNLEKASIPTNEVVLDLGGKYQVQTMAQFGDYMAVATKSGKIVFFNPRTGNIAYSVKVK